MPVKGNKGTGKSTEQPTQEVHAGYAVWKKKPSPEEIEKAMERGREKDQKVCQCEDEEREYTKKDQEMQLKERSAGLETTGEKNKVELEQAKANVDKTKKETTEIGKKPPSSGLK